MLVTGAANTELHWIGYLLMAIYVILLTSVSYLFLVILRLKLACDLPVIYLLTLYRAIRIDGYHSV